MGIMLSVFLLLLIIVATKYLRSPTGYYNENLDNIKRYLHILYFRGKICTDILKNGHMNLEDEELDKKSVFLKYKERGRYGIYFIIHLDKKSKRIEKIISRFKLNYCYEQLKVGLGKYLIKIDFKNDLDKVIPVINELGNQTGIFNKKLVFNIRYFNLVKSQSNAITFNPEDKELFERVKSELMLPATIGEEIIDKFRMKLIDKWI